MQFATAAQTVRWLVVHDLHDSVALWLVDQWRRRLGARASELLALPSPALTLCTRWQLRILGYQADTRLEIILGGEGAVRRFDVDSATLQGMLYRSGGPWIADTAIDRDYVVQEHCALLLAWLSGLSNRCVNIPHANALAGPTWSTPHWRWQAQRCGMPVVCWPDPVDTSPPLLRLLVVGERVITVNGPALGCAWNAAARRLAVAADCALLGLYLTQDGSADSRFALASVHADLRAGGTVASDALADVMNMPAIQGASVLYARDCA